MAIRSLARSSIRQAGRVNSALAGYESNHFHHLETVRLGGAAATVTFSNLTRYSDYQHLQLRVVQIGSNGSSRMTVNGDTGSNYAEHQLGSSGGVFSNGNANTTDFYLGALDTTNPSPFIVDILDCFETTKNKTFRTFFGSTGIVGLRSGLWRNIAAINQLTLTSPGTFSAGSRFSLYGLKARA